MKARIRRNIWDNWYGYLGGRRVQMFFGSEREQADKAKHWLREQQREGHDIDIRQLDESY